MSAKSSMRHEAQSMLANLLGRGEEVVSVFLEELGRNPRVREQLGKTVERAVDAKRRVDRTTESVLSVLNVPSRSDYNRLLAKVEALQGSLVNLSMKMDRLLAQQHSHPAPAPTAKPAAHAKPARRRVSAKPKAHSA